MELSRRRLFVLGAASAATATAGLVMAPGANAADLAAETAEQPLGHGTTYDQTAKQQNPANQLGCPLGKGL
ncbi:MAG: hypothetical protein HLX51_08135 [Micrococcaceae bacterium]|nr:hypothetical protein [Micrococcaceae bacterium]